MNVEPQILCDDCNEWHHPKLMCELPVNDLHICGNCLRSHDGNDCDEEGGNDAVEHPAHYTAHPSGVECITITEHMGFCVGNAIKYLWRADLKGNALEDLKKARYYVDREIKRRGGE